MPRGKSSENEKNPSLGSEGNRLKENLKTQAYGATLDFPGGTKVILVRKFAFLNIKKLSKKLFNLTFKMKSRYRLKYTSKLL